GSIMITAENIFDNFKFTMSGLEKGLQVIHITTPAAQLLCCQDDEDIETVLACDDLKPFDQIPVKKQETIIGLLKRRDCPEGAKGAAGKHMQPLGEKILVSADTSLLDFIQDKESLDRIVIGGTKIYGLVTKSDFLKLPVSLLGFALYTHIETLLLHMIRKTVINSEEWLTWIYPPHKKEIERDFKKLSRERSEPDKLELSYFSDKSTILERLATLEEYAYYVPDKIFIDQLKEIGELRNTIAHSRKASDNDDFLQQFIDRLIHAHKWIEDIEQWQTTKAHTAP
ncbi:MAG TPA: hypothetical protein VEP90_28990, partial [Methylomirabilota bacterium]|nr:hypothetical protein [Methylomirabilota bacterium]